MIENMKVHISPKNLEGKLPDGKDFIVSGQRFRAELHPAIDFYEAR